MADFKMVDSAMHTLAATHHAAGDQWSAAASADVSALFAALAAAIGPIGAPQLFLPAASALANCFGAAQGVGDLHHAIAAGTTCANVTAHAADNA